MLQLLLSLNTGFKILYYELHLFFLGLLKKIQILKYIYKIN